MSALRRDLSIYTRIYAALLTAIWHNRYHLASLRRRVQNARTVTSARLLEPTRWTLWKARMLLLHGLPQVR
jgi:hypothetical protein